MTDILTHKAFRYRIYPTPAQESRLLAWEGALRFLWNLAHEQRLMGLARPMGERRYPSTFDQQKEMTALRAELPWLNDVPHNAAANLLADLGVAWKRCFSRLGRQPNWKRKNGRAVGIAEPHKISWHIDGDSLMFPKLGALRIVLHRATSGTPRGCTIRRDGDQWFATIACDVVAPEPSPRTGPVVAIDRGITNLIADSDGNLVANPKHLEKALKRLARAQRTVSRRTKGSANTEKAKLRVMRIHRMVRRQREHFLQVHSARLAKSHGVVVIEKLNVAGMVKNRSLARRISGAGWTAFVELLRRKLELTGGSLVEVPAAYSSQTCSGCGCVDAASRDRDRFRCTGCGHVDHSDLNAAKVLLQRFQARANRSCQPVEGSALSSSRRSRKVNPARRPAASRQLIEGGRLAMGHLITGKDGGQ